MTAPERNLPPDAQDWGRWIEGRIAELTSRLGTASTAVRAANNRIAATARTAATATERAESAVGAVTDVAAEAGRKPAADWVAVGPENPKHGDHWLDVKDGNVLKVRADYGDNERTNYVLNPSFRYDATGWEATAGELALTSDDKAHLTADETGRAALIETTGRAKTIGVPAMPDDPESEDGGGSEAGEVGAQWTASAEVILADGALTATARITVVDADDVVVSDSGPITLAAGEVTRVTAYPVAGVASTTKAVRVMVESVSPDAPLFETTVDDVILEAVGYGEGEVQQYFDGSMPGALWQGEDSAATSWWDGQPRWIEAQDEKAKREVLERAEEIQESLDLAVAQLEQAQQWIDETGYELGNRLDQAETDITEAENRLTQAETAISEAEAAIDAIGELPDFSELEQRLSDAENELSLAEQSLAEVFGIAERALASGRNLSPRGMMEEDTLEALFSNYSSTGNFQIIDDATQAYQGSKFLRYTAQDGVADWAYLIDEPHVVEGRKYLISMTARLVSGSATGNRTGGMAPTWFNHLNQSVNMSVYYPSDLWLASAMLAGLTSEWKTFTGVVEVPPNVNVVRMRPRLYFNAGALAPGSVMDIDAITITDMTSSENILGVEIDKLLEGEGELPEGVARQIAAVSGKFLEIDVAQLNVTNVANLKQVVADAMWTKKISAKKVLANEVIIGGAGNDFPDPLLKSWSDAFYSMPTGTEVRAGGPDGANVLFVPAGAARTPNTIIFPVTAGRKYHVSIKARGQVAGSRFYIQVLHSGPGLNPYPISNRIITTDWDTYTGEFEMPLGASEARLAIYCNHANGVQTGWQEFTDIRVIPKIDANLVVDGAITARKITITGNPNDSDEAGLVAKIASIMELDVDHLTVTQGATMKTATITELWNQVVRSRKMTTDMLIVGGSNLLPDPSFEDAELTEGRRVRSAATAVSSGHTTFSYYYFVPSTSTDAPPPTTVKQYGIPVQPGEQYRIEIPVTLTSALSSTPRVETWNASGTGRGLHTISSTESDYTDGVLGYNFTVPSGAAYMAPVIYRTTQFTVHKGASVRQKVGGNLIVKGGVVAEHLNVVDVDEDTGFRMSLMPDGLRLWAGEDDLGEPSISLTSSDAQAISILDPETDERMAGMDTDGGVVGKVVSANDMLVANGPIVVPAQGLPTKYLEHYSVDDEGNPRILDLVEAVTTMPQGMVAWGQINPDNLRDLPNGAGEVGLFEIAWYPEGDNRMYEVSVSPFLVTVGGAGTVGLRMRYTNDGSAPTVNSQILGYNYIKTHTSGFETLDYTTRLIGGNNGNYLRVLVSLYASGTSATLYRPSAGGNSAYLFPVVRDLGLTTDPTAVPNHGNGDLQSGGGSSPAPSPTPPAKKRYVTEYYAKTSGGHRVFPTSEDQSVPTQGATPYYNPGVVRATHIYFDWDKIRADLSGVPASDIRNVSVFLYAEHWHSAAGGTVGLWTHPYNSLQSSIGNMAYIGSAKFARGQGRWLGLPRDTLWASGSRRGIGLYPPGGSSSTEYYGKFAGPNDPTVQKRPRLLIEYYK